MPSTSLLVELHRARDAHRQQLVLLRPERRRSSCECGTAPASGAARRAARGSSRSARPRPRPACRCPPSSPATRSRARRRTAAGPRFSLSASANSPELVVDPVERVVLLGHLEEGARIDLSDLFHRCLRSAEKSTSSSASWIRRRCSSSSSDMRVTFSVAMTVRFATSLRISSSARRVSASMSLRVDLHQLVAVLLGVRLGLGPRAGLGGPCRARATMSSACSRASFRRARYSSSSWSASRLVLLGRLDRLLDRPGALVERLRRCAGTRTAAGSGSVIPNAISVQIISPSSGETRKLPPSSSPPPPACSWASRNMSASVPLRGRRQSGRR